MAIIRLQKTQIAPLSNECAKQYIGEESLLKEDLSNVVEFGTAILNAGNEVALNYLADLPIQFAKMFNESRVYEGTAPKVMMDSWEFGQIVQKNYPAELIEASENQSWSLVDGGSYDDNQFIAPKVKSKLYKKSTTYEHRISITLKQLKDAFRSAEEYGSFLSMYLTNVQNSKTVKNDSLIMATINSATAEAFNSNKCAINLLAEYKGIHTNSSLTSTDCLEDADFLKYCAFRILSMSDKLTQMSTLYNVGGHFTFTPKNKQHIVTLTDFDKKLDVNLQSSVFHNEITELPKHDSIGFWQGTGTTGSFADCSSINVKTDAGNNVNAGGIVCVMFDEEALGVTNYEDETESHYVKSGQFTNYWFKTIAGYFVDLDMNFVVFYIAD